MVNAIDDVVVMSLDATLVCSLLDIVLMGITADVGVALENVMNDEEASSLLDTAMVDVEDDTDVGLLSDVMRVCSLSLLGLTLIEEIDGVEVIILLNTAVTDLDVVDSAETCSENVALLDAALAGVSDSADVSIVLDAALVNITVLIEIGDLMSAAIFILLVSANVLIEVNNLVSVTNILGIFNSLSDIALVVITVLIEVTDSVLVIPVDEGDAISLLDPALVCVTDVAPVDVSL